MGCPQNEDAHQVTAFDSESGHRISCSVDSAPAGGQQMWYFDVELPGEYRIQLLNATVPAGGGPVQGNGCQVRVTEGVNTYSGRCGAEAPNDDQPCQLNNIQFGTSMDGYPQASGSLLCRNIRDSVDAAVRDVTSPGAGGADRATPNLPLRLKRGACDAAALRSICPVARDVVTAPREL
jgi:hypothetical protein